MPINKDLLFQTLDEIINTPEKLAGGVDLTEAQKQRYLEIIELIGQITDKLSDPKNDLEIVPVLSGHCSQIMDKEGKPKKFYNINDPVIQQILNEGLKWEDGKYTMQHNYITDATTGQKGICVSMSDIKDASTYTTSKKIRRKVRTKLKNANNTLQDYKNFIVDAEHLLTAIRVPEGNASKTYTDDEGKPVMVKHPHAGQNIDGAGITFPPKVSLDQCGSSETPEQCYLKQNWKGDQACIWTPHLRHLQPPLEGDADKAWKGIKSSACVDIRSVPFPTRAATPTDENASNSSRSLAGTKDDKDPYRLLQSSDNPSGYVLTDADFENDKSKAVTAAYDYLRDYYDDSKMEKFSRTANNKYPQGVRIPVFFDNAGDSTFIPRQWNAKNLANGQYGEAQAAAAISIQRMFRKKKATGVKMPKNAEKKINGQYEKHGRAFQKYKEVLYALISKNEDDDDEKLRKFQRLLKEKKQYDGDTMRMIWEEEILANQIDLDGTGKKGVFPESFSKNFIALDNISLYVTYHLAKEFPTYFTDDTDLGVLLLADQRDKHRPVLVTKDEGDCDAALVNIGLEYAKVDMKKRKPIYAKGDKSGGTIKTDKTLGEFLGGIQSKEEMYSAVDVYMKGERPISELFNKPLDPLKMPKKLVDKSYAVLWAGGSAEDYDGFGKYLEGGALTDFMTKSVNKIAVETKKTGKKLTKEEFLEALQKAYTAEGNTMSNKEDTLNEAYKSYETTYDDLVVAVKAKVETKVEPNTDDENAPPKVNADTKSQVQSAKDAPTIERTTKPTQKQVGDVPGKKSFNKLLVQMGEHKEGNSSGCHFPVGVYQVMVLKGAAKGGHLQKALAMIKRIYSKTNKNMGGKPDDPKGAKETTKRLRNLTANEETLLEMMMRPDLAVGENENDKGINLWKDLRIAVREVVFNYPIYKWIKYHAKDSSKLSPEQKTKNGALMQRIAVDGVPKIDKSLNEDPKEWKTFTSKAYPSVFYQFDQGDDTKNMFIKMAKGTDDGKEGWVYASNSQAYEDAKAELQKEIEKLKKGSESQANYQTAYAAIWGWATAPLETGKDYAESVKKMYNEGGVGEILKKTITGDVNAFYENTAIKAAKEKLDKARVEYEKFEGKFQNLDSQTKLYKAARDYVTKRGTYKTIDGTKDLFDGVDKSQTLLDNGYLESVVGTQAIEMLTRLQLFAPGKFEYRVDTEKGIIYPYSKEIDEKEDYEWGKFYTTSADTKSVKVTFEVDTIRKVMETQDGSNAPDALKNMLAWVDKHHNKLGGFLTKHQKQLEQWRNLVGAPKGIATKKN